VFRILDRSSYCVKPSRNNAELFVTTSIYDDEENKGMVLISYVKVVVAFFWAFRSYLRLQRTRKVPEAVFFAKRSTFLYVEGCRLMK